MTVLVTGGAGFIGSHFIERLLADDSSNVICLDNFNDQYDPRRKRANAALFADNPRVKVVEGSFCDERLVERLLAAEGVRHIVHLGALAGVRASISQAIAYEETNIRGTLVLLEAARSQGVERFVLVSSSTVYGRNAEVPFREDAPLGVPASPYGATKRAAELLALTYHALHGLPAVCVRPFSVYGPRMRPDLAMCVFAESILKSRPVPLLGDGSARRDFTHVRDVCEGLVAALWAENVAGEAINLGHHEPATIRQLITLLEETLGRKAKIDQRPACAVDLDVTCADLTKAERLLGYRPRVPLVDGVREFCAWIRAILDV